MVESPGSSQGTSSIMSEFRNNLKKQRLAASTPPPASPPRASPSPVSAVSSPILSAASSITSLFGGKKEEVIIPIPRKKRVARKVETVVSTDAVPSTSKPLVEKIEVEEDKSIATAAAVEIKDDGQNVIKPTSAPLAVVIPASTPTSAPDIVGEEEADGWDLEVNEEEEEAAENAPSVEVHENGDVEVPAFIKPDEEPESESTALIESTVVPVASTLSLPLVDSTLAANSPATITPSLPSPVILDPAPEIISVKPAPHPINLDQLSESVEVIESPPASTAVMAKPLAEEAVPLKSAPLTMEKSDVASIPVVAISTPIIDVLEELPVAVVDAAPANDLNIVSDIVEKGADSEIVVEEGITEVKEVEDKIESPVIEGDAPSFPSRKRASSTLKDPRLAEMTTAYKRLQGLKSNLDTIVSELLPVVSSVSDVESFERELKNLLSKSEMSMGEVRRLSNESALHKERLQEIRDTHRMEAKSQSDLIDKLKVQLEQKDMALKLLSTKLGAAEETAKLADAATILSNEAHEKTKIVAKEEEEKRVKALSLLRALRQKLVKSDKDRDEANAVADQLRLTGASASDQVRSELVKHERDIGQQRMMHDSQLVKLRNSFDREISALKGQYEKETSARKSQFELDVITARAAHAKEITAREKRIGQLEGTVRELTVSRDSTFDSLQVKTAESESSLDHSRASQMELVELRYTMKELEDRVAASREELEEVKRTQKDATRDDTHLRRLLAEAESRSETKSRDLLSKIVQLEADRQATELEMSITLLDRTKEIEKMRKEMIVKEREWKESLGERAERESIIEIGERQKKELQEKIKGLDLLALELREEVIKSSQAELAVREELQDRVQRASELESRLDETQTKESNLRSNNKLLREELRKVQSDVLLSEKRRNPGVGYFASLSQPQHQHSPQYSTSQQQTQFQPSSYPLSINTDSPTGSPTTSRSSHYRLDSSEGSKSPISPISRSASIASLPLSELDRRVFSSRDRRTSIDSNVSGLTEGPSIRDRAKEREDEAVNFEYLRNVLLEFLEKPAMRPQLIGVMGVILRFTPAEARRLASKVGSVN